MKRRYANPHSPFCGNDRCSWASLRHNFDDRIGSYACECKLPVDELAGDIRQSSGSSKAYRGFVFILFTTRLALAYIMGRAGVAKIQHLYWGERNGKESTDY